jgi:hypothetical protein
MIESRPSQVNAVQCSGRMVGKPSLTRFANPGTEQRQLLVQPKQVAPEDADYKFLDQALQHIRNLANPNPPAITSETLKSQIVSALNQGDQATGQYAPPKEVVNFPYESDSTIVNLLRSLRNQD